VVELADAVDDPVVNVGLLLVAGVGRNAGRVPHQLELVLREVPHALDVFGHHSNHLAVALRVIPAVVVAANA